MNVYEIQTINKWNSFEHGTQKKKVDFDVFWKTIEKFESKAKGDFGYLLYLKYAMKKENLLI